MLFPSLRGVFLARGVLARGVFARCELRHCPGAGRGIQYKKFSIFYTKYREGVTRPLSPIPDKKGAYHGRYP